MDLDKRATTEAERPQALRRRPVLNQYQAAYWRMYQELTGSRQFTSSGVAEIPYNIKVLWLDENEIFCPDERNDYMTVVSTIDSEYVGLYYEKHKVK